jgi:hypothetical protein
MESIENKISNLPKPEQFIQNLETLQSQLTPILDDFKKYYVFYNKNPEYQEYQTNFQNIKGNLNNINSQLFTLSNSVQSSTDQLNKKLFGLDILIKKERETNKKLKRAVGIVENKNNVTSELILNYKTMYDSGYLRNWALFLATIIVGISIKIIFKKPQTISFNSSLKN